jgi:hypothetical protein
MGLDPTTHRLFLVSAKFGQAAVESTGNNRRGPMVPGSFSMMVIERDPAAR